MTPGLDQQARMFCMKYYINWRHYIVSNNNVNAASRYKRFQMINRPVHRDYLMAIVCTKQLNKPNLVVRLHYTSQDCGTVVGGVQYIVSEFP